MKELEFIISQDKLTLTDVKNILSKNLKLKLSNKSIERINTNRNYLDSKLNNKDQVFMELIQGLVLYVILESLITISRSYKSI